MDNKSIYSKAFTITTNDVDLFGNFKPVSILNFFQFLAGQHADILGVGADCLIKENCFWILIRQDINIIKYPQNSQQVIVSTWPRLSKGFFMYRDFEYRDCATNELLIEGTTIWGIFSKNTNRLVRGDNLVFNCNDFCQKKVESGEHIDFKEMSRGDFSFEQTTMLSDLDANYHINNTKYLEYSYNTLDINFLQKYYIKGFHIKYYLQTKLDEKLDLYKINNNESIQIQGFDKDNHKHFATVFDISEKE